MLAIRRGGGCVQTGGHLARALKPPSPKHIVHTHDALTIRQTIQPQMVQSAETRTRPRRLAMHEV